MAEATEVPDPKEPRAPRVYKAGSLLVREKALKELREQGILQKVGEELRLPLSDLG